jgi:glycosyltransferase involved in cell wall biosynthesis
MVCRAHPNLTLVTTTSREQTSDKDEYDALQERAAELGVDDHWVELGYVPHRELPSLYRTADMYAFPSFTESFGHSMVEAMASGLPVVASDKAVHREVCEGAAAYFDTFDAVDCADTICDVLDDKEQRAAMRQAAMCRVHHFSWEQYVGQLAEVFEHVTPGKT